MSIKNKNILVVDDSNTNTLLLRSILETEGFEEISIANNGKQALKQIETGNFDLILLDIKMPNKLDGFDVLKILKENPDTENIPVIIVSANSEDSEIEKGLNLGAIDYLTKPINIEKLIHILKELFK